MSFNFLNGCTLKEEDFQIGKREIYIEDFLLENNVNLIYSPPKQGKTWLGYGIANLLASKPTVKGVIYNDMDNGITELKERGVNNKLINHPKIDYVSRAKIGCSPMEYIRKIDRETSIGNFKSYVFVFETTKDFVDTDSKTQSEEFMKIVMRIRDAGGTVIIMHHATKTGRTISGVQVFINSPDNVYEMVQKAREDNKLHFALNVTHSRSLVTDIGVTVNTESLELTKLDEVFATMSESDERFVKNAKEILKANPVGMKQKEFLEAMDYKATDKTARSLLEKFEGKFWDKHQEKRGKPATYTLR